MFVVGLSSVAAVMAHTARRLPVSPRRARVVKAALYAFALCIVGNVVRSDDVATRVSDLHIADSAALFAGQIFLAAWLTLIDRRRRTGILLFPALFAAGLVAMASRLSWISHLFAGEVAFQTIFLILLALVVSDLALTGTG